MTEKDGPLPVYGAEQARRPMIDFRGHEGTCFGLPYESLNSISYDPAEGIVLEFKQHRVLIKGRNLESLREDLLQHRVSYVREDRFDHAPEAECFVESIVIDGTKVVIPAIET